MRNYAVRLKEYGIDRDLYLELKYFCRQYRRKVSELSGMADLRASALTGMPRSGGQSDPTARAVERRERLREDTRAIEQAAIQADAELYPYILRNVTDGVSFEVLRCPCGINQFYLARRKFFWVLAGNLGKLS